MKVTYFGHACFLVEVGNKKIIFDPFISPNEKAKHIDVSIIEADYMLVSHGHVDHVADVEAISQQTGAKLVSNFEIVSWFGAKGVANGHPMNIGGTWNFDFGKVKYVNALHSSTLPDGSGGGNPGGFVIESTHGNFYFAGDTALTYDMKLIGEQTKLDFAFLPIGDNFTMGIDDAIKACEFIKCKNIVGMHYDTFGVIEINHEEAIRKFNEKGLSLTLLNIGETKEI